MGRKLSQNEIRLLRKKRARSLFSFGFYQEPPGFFYGMKAAVPILEDLKSALEARKLTREQYKSASALYRCWTDLHYTSDPMDNNPYKPGWNNFMSLVSLGRYALGWAIGKFSSEGISPPKTRLSDRLQRNVWQVQQFGYRPNRGRSRPHY